MVSLDNVLPDNFQKFFMLAPGIFQKSVNCLQNGNTGCEHGRQILDQGNFFTVSQADRGGFHMDSTLVVLNTSSMVVMPRAALLRPSASMVFMPSLIASLLISLASQRVVINLRISGEISNTSKIPILPS